MNTAQGLPEAGKSNMEDDREKAQNSQNSISILVFLRLFAAISLSLILPVVLVSKPRSPVKPPCSAKLRVKSYAGYLT
jgi:hypothetical protein